MTDGSLDDSHRDLDPSLEPHFASLLSRHKEAVAKTEWSYQQFLPPEIEKHSLSPTAYMAVETALLTEVNLPWYTAGLAHGLASCADPIQEFVRVWTSEEDQHATLLESYLLLTRSGYPGARARSRKAMIAGGVEPRAGRTVPGDGLHGHARGGDPHVLPVRGSRLWRRGSAAGRGAAADRQGRDPSHGLLP